jgi:uncharacterized cupin superfamily protein
MLAIPFLGGTAMSSPAEQLRRQLIRNFNDAALTREERAPLYDTMCARLARGTAAAQLGASIDVLAPGKRGCPYHAHHAQEEMFIVLEGQGTLRVAGELLPIGPGDMVFIPAGPEWPHQIINNSDAPLKFLSISTNQFPEICEYPDSGKYLSAATVGGERYGFSRIHRADTDLDYWDGEP